MNAPVSRELERQRAAERAQREQALATEVYRALSYVRPVPDQAVTERARPFMAYCAARGVAYLPARPETVAAFLISKLDVPPALESIMDVLEAIEAQHDAMALASPIRSSVVDAALSYWPRLGVPRSWPAADKIEFMRAPPHIQRVVARRESQRDREIRRIQNEAANGTTTSERLDRERGTPIARELAQAEGA